jgi:hypothetical protein
MVSIGVTGHRDLDNVKLITSSVDEVLRKIRNTFPGETLTIISPLAEGADRLVVWRAMENNDVHLVVPLPLEISEYMQDFSGIYSKAEFVTLLEQAAQVIELPAEETREASYLAAGSYILDHSDLLIAVWDGQPARGPGGTGQIVAQAREKLMPIAWVFSGDQDPHPQSIAGKTPGEVAFENFP